MFNEELCLNINCGLKEIHLKNCVNLLRKQLEDVEQYIRRNKESFELGHN